MRGLLSDRSITRISGVDARTFLQGLVTQDLLHVREGAAVFAALLTPQGKILFDFILTPAGDGFLLDCAASEPEALVKRLSLYKLRAKVTVTPEPELAVAIGEMRDPVSAFEDPRHQSLPWRAVIKRADMPVADKDYEDARLSLGVPEFGKDFGGDEAFLLDVNYDALNAVSYKKGCFVGQEVTSRMKRKGEVRKRSLIASFDGEPPAKGSPLTAGDVQLGEIMSGKTGGALALVRVDRLKEAADQGMDVKSGGRTVRLTFPDYLKQV